MVAAKALDVRMPRWCRSKLSVLGQLAALLGASAVAGGSIWACTDAGGGRVVTTRAPRADRPAYDTDRPRQIVPIILIFLILPNMLSVEGARS